MSAETLRRAAVRLRESAESEPDRTVKDARVEAVWLNAARYLTISPAVALAVADWLDAIAPRFPSRLRDFEEHLLDREQAAALAVARAYLGESA